MKAMKKTVSQENSCGNQECSEVSCASRQCAASLGNALVPRGRNQPSVIPWCNSRIHRILNVLPPLCAYFT